MTAIEILTVLLIITACIALMLLSHIGALRLERDILYSQLKQVAKWAEAETKEVERRADN